MTNKIVGRITLLFLAFFLTSCQPATPLPPLTITTDAEFTLAPDQTATLANTQVTIRLIGVGGEQRCPSGIECAISGPVSVSLSVQQENATPAALNLQTFTDNNGRAPGTQFQGIKDRATFNGYEIRVVAVLPYPVSLTNKIKDSDYRVTLVASKK